jgi:hypothetical protein
MRYYMKQFFYSMVLMLTTTITIAQNNSRQVAQDLKATIEQNNLLLTWSADKLKGQGSWQVEASGDGNHFNLIGLVWGADPKAEGTTFSFKQKNEKIRSGYRFYRVVFVGERNELEASKSIGLTK